MTYIRPLRCLRLFVAAFALIAITLGPVGCAGPKQSVNAAAIDALVFSMTERHDGYVNTDTRLSQSEKDTYLRTSTLLRTIMDQAMGRVKNTVPTTATGRTQ